MAQASCEDFPEGFLDDDRARKHPDIVLLADGRRFGIEVTEVYHDETKGGSKQRSLAEQIEQTMQMATEMLRKMELPPLHVFVLLHVEDGFRRDVLAKKLVEYVAANVPAEDDWHEVPPNRLRDESVPTQVHSLIIRRARHDYTSFQTSQVTIVPELTHEHLFLRLREKHKRFHSYMANCDEVWLLLVINTQTLATHFCLETLGAMSAIPTKFTRVYLLNEWDGQAVRLPVIRLHE